MKKILLIDPNKSFSIKIQNLLNPLLSPIAQISSYTCDTEKLSHSPSFNFNLSNKFADNIDLFIIHESFAGQDFFHNQPHLILKENGQKSANFLCRRSDMGKWQKTLMQALDKQTVKPDIPANPVIAFYAFNASLRRQYFQSLLLNYIRRNKKIFILPLKPLYTWYYDAQFHQGKTLSDLILQIEENIAVSYQQVGHIFEKQKEPFFLARPSKGFDDILYCEDIHLFRIVDLFQQFIRNHSKDAVGIIDIENLKFEIVKNIAFQINFAYIDIPQEKHFGAIKAKTLLAEFLAEKPNSCTYLPLQKEAEEN